MTETTKKITENLRQKGNPDSGQEIISFACKEDFENWMQINYRNTNGIWIRFYKKNSAVESINYDQALEIALCYGWIDGQLKKMDEESYIQKFTPRRPKSIWSKRNVAKAETLIKEGKMQPSGLTEFEKAKADGRFENAYDSPENMVIPDDFLDAIKKNKNAYEFFKTLNKTNLYTIGWRLQTAKTAITREKRIVSIIEKLEKQEKFH